MISWRKYLVTFLILFMTFAFFGYVLFNKSSAENVEERFTEGRVIDKNNQVYKNLASNKKNIVHFWATWCSTCNLEHEVLKEYSSTHEDINLISVLFKDDISNVDQNTLNKLYKLNIDDPNGFLALDFGVSGVPESFIVDDKGKIIKHIIGNIKKGDLN